MGVAESDIQRAVANGARTLEDVEDATGAGTRCGRCVGAIEACLQRELAALAS
jgi:bacterioferritin-associated ferredoxin